MPRSAPPARPSPPADRPWSPDQTALPPSAHSRPTQPVCKAGMRRSAAPKLSTGTVSRRAGRRRVADELRRAVRVAGVGPFRSLDCSLETLVGSWVATAPLHQLTGGAGTRQYPFTNCSLWTSVAPSVCQAACLRRLQVIFPCIRASFRPQRSKHSPSPRMHAAHLILLVQERGSGKGDWQSSKRRRRRMRALNTLDSGGCG
jgi:hypothetical protein